MYFYLYDVFLQKKKYEKILANIEAKLTDLSINGIIGRLNILKNSTELIHDAVKRGAKTIVVLGDDTTFSNTLNSIINLSLEHNIALGIIPIGEGAQTIADNLSITTGESACETISRRVKAKIDIGRVNENVYFINHLECLDDFFVIEGQGGYRITSAANKSQCFICNFKNLSLIPERPFNLSEPYKNFFKPQDGLMEVIISPEIKNSILQKIFVKNQNKTNNLSILSFKNIKIFSLSSEKAVRLRLDGYRILKTPAAISVLPQKIEVIVGRERKF